MARYKKATMSILGLYYLDHSIFDNMVYPPDLNKDVLINSIVAECAELEIIYPDPDYIKYLIGIWSQKELYNWQKLYDTTQLVYNPIWNVDADITETETRNLANNFQNTEAALNSATDSTTHSQTGYNDLTFVGSEKDDGTADSSSNIDRSGGDTETGTIERRIKRGGNIGVTMTQEMIAREREINQFNIYDYIIDSFKRKFCLLLY